ncbi:MAG: cadherin-like beta sandwich domain-containing protein [Bacilli bacterium]
MKNRIVLFIVLLITPFCVKANSILVTCDTDIVKGTSLKCSINGVSEGIVSAVSAKVRTGSNIKFSSFIPNSSWQGDGEEGKIDLYTASDMTGNFVIGTLNFDVTSIYEGGNSTITIDSIFFYDENGKESSVAPITNTIRIASTNNDLYSLSLSTGNLSPVFSSNITSYSAIIDASAVTINARASSNYASISGIGKVNLNYGSNTFRVIVTSESGTTKTYNINIVRPNNTNNNTSDTSNSDNNTTNLSSNNYLSNITLSNGNINFNKNITEYNITVDYQVSNIEVIAIVEDSKSKVEITGNTNLEIGNNIIEIKVIAEDNSTRIYKINVEKKDENYVLSSNNNISSVNIKNYDFDFNSNITNYTLTIKDEEKLDIEVILEDSKSTYNIQGNNNLKNNSVIKIEVIAEDGTTKIYQIDIKSSDRFIKSIFIIIIIILLIINIVRLFLKYRRLKNERIYK